MKYIVDLDTYMVCECEKYNEVTDQYGIYYECEVYDEKNDQFVEIVTDTLFDTRKEAQASSDELSELKEAEMQYRSGYDYACGYYD